MFVKTLSIIQSCNTGDDVRSAIFHVGRSERKNQVFKLEFSAKRAYSFPKRPSSRRKSARTRSTFLAPLARDVWAFNKLPSSSNRYSQSAPGFHRYTTLTANGAPAAVTTMNCCTPGPAIFVRKFKVFASTETAFWKYNLKCNNSAHRKNFTTKATRAINTVWNTPVRYKYALHEEWLKYVKRQFSPWNKNTCVRNS